MVEQTIPVEENLQYVVNKVDTLGKKFSILEDVVTRDNTSLNDMQLKIENMNKNLQIMLQTLLHSIDIPCNKNASILASDYHSILDAAKDGNAKALLHLLENGTNVNKRDKNGNTALHLSAICGHLNATIVLLGGAADINIRGELGHTPLHAAVLGGHPGIVQRLLNRGALVNEKNDRNETALTLAKEKGDREIELLLLEHVAASVTHEDKEVQFTQIGTQRYDTQTNGLNMRQKVSKEVSKKRCGEWSMCGEGNVIVGKQYIKELCALQHKRLINEKKINEEHVIEQMVQEIAATHADKVRTIPAMMEQPCSSNQNALMLMSPNLTSILTEKSQLLHMSECRFPMVSQTNAIMLSYENIIIHQIELFIKRNGKATLVHKINIGERAVVKCIWKNRSCNTMNKGKNNSPINFFVPHKCIRFFINLLTCTNWKIVKVYQVNNEDLLEIKVLNDTYSRNIIDSYKKGVLWPKLVKKIW